MEPVAVTIRTARVGDTAAIGACHVLSWQTAYAGQFPQSFLDGLDPDARAAGWRRYLKADDHDREALTVAEIDGEAVGFASVGPCRDPDRSAAGELYALYLLPEVWGRGVGRTLIAATVETLAGFGFAEATLWVLDTNARARRFYQAAGWAADGASRVEESFAFPIPEVRYRRALP